MDSTFEFIAFCMPRALYLNFHFLVFPIETSSVQIPLLQLLNYEKKFIAFWMLFMKTPPFSSFQHNEYFIKIISLKETKSSFQQQCIIWYLGCL